MTEACWRELRVRFSFSMTLNIRFILFQYKEKKTSAKAVYHDPQGLPSLGRTIPASKEDALGGVVSDEEEERMVCVEFLHYKCTAERHDSRGSSSSLSSLLIDVHKSFVNHLREDQVVVCGHAWQAGEWGRFLITISSILISKSHLEKGSYQRSRSWPRRRHPPCPSWPGRSSC